MGKKDSQVVSQEKYYVFKTDDRNLFNRPVPIKGEGITLLFNGQGVSSPIKGTQISKRVQIVQSINRWELEEWDGDIPSPDGEKELKVKINDLETELKNLDSEYKKSLEIISGLEKENEGLVKQIEKLQKKEGK